MAAHKNLPRALWAKKDGRTYSFVRRSREAVVGHDLGESPR
jgi:hypothetical protein